MAADRNKVEFGISNLYVGTYSVDPEGTVTLGTPYHQIGAVSLSLDSESESNDFYADNVKFWSGYSDNGFTGSIEVAKFDKDFKTQFLGYVTGTNGGISKIKGANKPNTYVAFQTEGDQEGRRVILYNVALGEINREYSTIEDTKEPITESLDITVTGDNVTNVVLTSFDESEDGYSTLFTNPPVPTLPETASTTAQTSAKK